MTAAPIVIPEDEAVLGILNGAEQLLYALASVNDPDINPDADTDPWVLPAAIADGAALAALQRIVPEIRNVLPRDYTGFDDYDKTRPRLLAPEGRYELVPARLVHVDSVDVELLQQTARVCGQSLDPDARRDAGFARTALLDLAEVLDQLVDSLPNDEPAPRSAAQLDPRVRLFAPVARLAALLTIDPVDADHQALVDALADRLGDVVLGTEQERAYQVLADRWNRVLADGDPLQRWVYRS